MKKSLLQIVGVLFIATSMLNAQELAMHTPPVKESKTKMNVEKTLASKYKFTVYGEIPVLKTAFEEKHFLGSAISEKWNTFCKNYTRVYEISVGLSGSTVEIMKPAVYNAVQKVNRYYKKGVKLNKINRDEAICKLSHILDCANVICLEYETEAFELAVSNAKSPEEIIKLFDFVELSYL